MGQRPVELGGRKIVRELSPGTGQTFLAEDLRGAGKLVVLKMLEEDCLLEGQLHPSIRLRLGRISEMAAKHVANLHGVERD
ncbi:MAG TPA: hypothetical protein VF669_12655, partial [Tepidisphaeraceae bacterium]